MSWPPADGIYNRAKQAERALSHLQRQRQPQVVPIFQAVRERRIDLFMPTQATVTLPPALLTANPSVPILATIADSDVDRPTGGPDAWPCAVQAMEWACPGFYPNGDPQGAELFELLVEMTIEYGRFLYVETVPERVNAWRRFAGVAPPRLAVC